MPHRSKTFRPSGRALVVALGVAAAGCGPDNEEVGLKGSQPTAASAAGGPDYNSATSSEEAHRLGRSDGGGGTPANDTRRTP